MTDEQRYLIIAGEHARRAREFRNAANIYDLGGAYKSAAFCRKWAEGERAAEARYRALAAKLAPATEGR